MHLSVVAIARLCESTQGSVVSPSAARLVCRERAMCWSPQRSGGNPIQFNSMQRSVCRRVMECLDSLPALWVHCSGDSSELQCNAMLGFGSTGIPGSCSSVSGLLPILPILQRSLNGIPLPWLLASCQAKYPCAAALLLLLLWWSRSSRRRRRAE